MESNARSDARAREGPGSRNFRGVGASTKDSAKPYLFVLVVAAASAGFAEHVTGGQALIWGQSAGTLIPVFGTLIAVGLWMPLQRWNERDALREAFLVSLLILWVVHGVLTRFHGDAVMYSVWMAPVAILLLAWKPPNQGELLSALRVLGWVLLITLASTRSLEVLGVLDVFALPAGNVAFDIENYWLPFSGQFGLEGRWPGPLRHPNEVGVVAAFLVVLAGIVKSKSGWAFGVAGFLFLLLAGTRVGYVAAASGVAVLLAFGSAPLIRNIQLRVRLAGALALVGMVALIMLSQSMNLTGRTNSIWPAFLDLWERSPWFGVGSSGMKAAGGITEQYMHGHNIVIDELARNGLVGLAALVSVMGVAAIICVRALLKAKPDSAAIVITFLVVGVSHTPLNWLTFSPVGVVLVLGVLLATQQVPGRPIRTGRGS